MTLPLNDDCEDQYNVAADQETEEKAHVHQSERCSDGKEETTMSRINSKIYYHTKLINTAQGNDFRNSNINTTLQASDSEQTKDDLPMQQNTIDHHISDYGSLDPFSEEICLVEKLIHHDGTHYTEPNTSKIIHSNLHENTLMHVQTDRGDKPPVSTLNLGSSFSSFKRPLVSNNLRSFASTDDGTNLNETTVGLSSGYFSGRSNYSESSFKAQIVGAGSSHYKGVDLAGVYSETDKVPCKRGQTLGINPSKDAQSKCSDYATTQSITKSSNHDRHVHIPHDSLLYLLLNKHMGMLKTNH